jgi:chromosome segregation ATPase
MTKNIEAEEVNVKAAATKVVEAEQKLADAKKTSDEEAKKFDTELSNAKGKLDELEQQKVKTAGNLKMVQKKLVEAEERFGKAENDLEEAKKKNKDADANVASANKDLKDAKEFSTFIEFKPLTSLAKMASNIVAGWWNRDCDEACQQLKAYNSNEYIRKSSVDAAVKAKPETLSKVFGEQLDKMKDTLDALQAKLARHKVLHDHDVNLHKEIMGELEKEFAGIKKALADLGADIALMEAKRHALDKTVTILSNRLQSMITAQADKIDSEERRIARTEKETQSMITRMELAEAKLNKIAAQNKECKEGVAALKKDAQEKQKEVGILKRAQEILVEDLTKADEKTQELVDRAASHKAKMAAEIKNVQRESQETEAAIADMTEDMKSVWKKKQAADAQTENIKGDIETQKSETSRKEKEADATRKNADKIMDDKLARL